MIQVQGSARVTLPDGRKVRLVYDGRNGKPYTSIGRSLIAAGEIGADEMSLARLKSWLRAKGCSRANVGAKKCGATAPMSSFASKRIFAQATAPMGGAGRL